MATAFDRALELTEVTSARELYAARYGEPGSVGYSAAWLKFHQRIKTIGDLQRLRDSAASKRRQLKVVTPRPADKPRAPKVGQPPKVSQPQRLVHAA